MKTQYVNKGNGENRVVKYPILAKWMGRKFTPTTELIVLFTGPRTGVAIHSKDSTSESGEYSANWCNVETDKDWKILGKGETVILSNDEDS